MPATKTATEAKPKSTVVWGADLEKDDFIKVPRSVLWFNRYYATASAPLLPRHLVLILALAAHKYLDRSIRRYWEELAKDLGTSPDTVRKWGRELKARGWLGIRQHRGRDRKSEPPGHKNERNTFDLTPFAHFLREQVFPKRRAELKERRRKRATEGAE